MENEAPAAKHALAYCNRGHVWLMKGDLARAITDYGMAIALDPQEARLRVHRAEAHARNGDDVAAIADYRDAIARKPASQDLYVRRGALYLRRFNLWRALMDFYRAYRLM